MLSRMLVSLPSSSISLECLGGYTSCPFHLKRACGTRPISEALSRPCLAFILILPGPCYTVRPTMLVSVLEYAFAERARVADAFFGPEAELSAGERALTRRIQLVHDL